VHAFLTTGKIFSKDEGGVYGLEALPALFHTLIQQALDVYRGMRPATSFEENSLETFATFMDQALLK
ncbi:MAG TPA: aminoglycoside adenylyltransferase domain-containing protein, partial [Ktedonobacteraceae bacterium]|nr:aminoglycoside adenylyltransferase domain-containing protein [Ktedonobacteraceae bacterium]